MSATTDAVNGTPVANEEPVEIDNGQEKSIVDTTSHMEALDKKAPSTIIERSEDDKLKSEWTKMFLEGNGFQYVLKIFMEKNLKKQADGDTPSTADWFDLKHFAFLLKLLRIFIMAAFSLAVSQPSMPLLL